MPLPPIIPQAPVILPVHHVVKPLKSFKSFMHFQNDDCTPEEFQKRYEDYHLKYLFEFSDAFFHVSKSEEWFRDRYNPLRLQEQEKESSNWAVKESAVIKTNLINNTVATIEAMSLDPPPGTSNRKHKNIQSNEQTDNKPYGINLYNLL